MYLSAQVAHRARTAGDGIAVSAPGVRVTYRQLDAAADSLAARLTAAGVEPGSVVAVSLPRSVETVTAVLGVMRAGGVYLPLDPGHPAERLRMLAASAAFLVHDGAPVPQGLTDLIAVPVGGPPQSHPAAPATDLADGPPQRRLAAPGPDPADLAYLMHTSGSTGQPKGVMISHGSIGGYARDMSRAYEITSRDRWLQFASLGFDASMEDIMLAIGSGAELVLRTQDMLEPGQLLAECARLGVTVLNLPTEYWLQLLEAVLAGAVVPESLRLVLIGGDRAPAESVRQWCRHPELGRVRLVNGYGPTEATIAATCWTATAEPLEQPGLRTAPIGRPVPGAQVLLLDADLRPARSGELFLGGRGLARGYLNAPGRTAERFVPHPAGRGERLYRTGDLARLLPSGELEFLGRIDDQVKIRGMRVEPAEVDAVLSTVPGVTAAVTVARDDGRGGKQLVSYVTPAVGDALPGPLAHLRERLPAHLVPIAVVRLEAFPVTVNGKVDRAGLAAREVSAAPLSDTGTRPRTATEAAVAEAFEQVLDLQRVGVEDDFFALGGHSLLVAQIVARLRERLAVPVQLGHIFETPQIAALAERIDAGDLGGGTVLPAVAPREADADRTIPLSFSQEMVWFLGQLAPDATAYNTQFALRLRGRLDRAALERTLTEIVRRHEVLRTSFPSDRGTPRQVVGEPWTVRLDLDDLTDLSPDAQEQRLLDTLRTLNQPFDVATERLLRWRLLRLGEVEHLLVQIEHHFVHDGWSVGRLLTELKEIYPAYAADREHSLPELQVQYADFTLWQRGLVSSGALQDQRDYWRHTLSGGNLPSLALFGTRPRPVQPRFRGAMEPLVVPRELCDRLAVAGGSGATLFMTMYAAFAVLCSAFTGTEDVVIGSSSANRSQRPIEDLLGMIVNPLVLRTDLSGDPDFTTVLHRARRTVIGAFSNADLPFEMIVRDLRPRHDPGKNPFFQVSFAFHDTPLPDLDMGEVTGRIEYHIGESAKFDLNITGIRRPPDPFDHKDGGYVLEWEYNADLYRRSEIKRLVHAYAGLLEHIVRHPGSRLSDLVGFVRDSDRQSVHGNRRDLGIAARRSIGSVRRPVAPAVLEKENQ
ncbi:amino acid adenylation domain-containing protein [Streptomyces sp. NPDC051940]|uniref:amino acid adenylation domain-containing protein n=1 Tax=Streptomyces sp. NPDC051940 TaxID=3155675 RepID=UPI00343B11AD